ncbi:hypothetical protein K492DRAFT_128678 [Lichtheimia hyalospora FSU 10163]|nr:hypothetical protein K492DRAFT_128678 [Lichtheimia hyalospora FSU 10163]
MHAFDTYLSRFTEPHPVNSRENIAMKAWLDSLAYDFQKEGNKTGVQVDVVTKDGIVVANENVWFAKSEQWIMESRNLIVRLRGQLDTEEAVLINAHYDSVPTAPGVTDNGMGVSVALELLRYFIQHPPRHSIIFLINNAEEGGLVGAKQFTKHPWFPTVKMFINLEGAGAGGRAMVFRCSSMQAIKHVAAHAPLAHATPLGNDMFKLGLIKSDTDYTIFTQQGVPGVDIAFYAPRSHYHTPRDNLSNTSPKSVQHMGDITLEALKAIDKDDSIFTEQHESKMVYYDIIGRVMLAYGFATQRNINILILVVVPLMALVWTSMIAGPNKGHLLGQRMAIVAQGFFATIIGFLFTAIFVGIAATVLFNINTMVTYGNAISVSMYLFLAAVLGLTTSQILCTKPEFMRKTLLSPESSFYGVIAFWWTMVILSLYATSNQVAVMYFSIFILASNVIAVTLYNAMPTQSFLRMPLVFLTQILVPFIILIDQNYLLMDTMRHATVDGTPEAAVYALMSLPIVLMVIQLQPWIHIAGRKRSAAISITTLLVLVFAICCVLKPFNDGWSPNKMLYREEYNATSGLTTVSLTAAWGVAQALKKTLAANEVETLSCHVHNTYQTQCKYQTSLVPIYADNPDEIQVSKIETSCDNDVCRLDTVFTSKNSILCRLRLDTDDDGEIIKGWAHGLETPHDKELGALVVYNLEYGQPFEMGVEYKKTGNATMSATIGCHYDEWTKGEIPAFTYLLDHLGKDTTVLIRGQGLATVNYQRITL